MRTAILILSVILLTGCRPCVKGHYEQVWIEAYDDSYMMVMPDGNGGFYYMPVGGYNPAHWEDRWVCEEYGK